MVITNIKAFFDWLAQGVYHICVQMYGDASKGSNHLLPPW